MIKLLIVEDSRVVSEHLYYIFSRDPQIQVIGNVSNGKQAIEFIKEHTTDVITMDIDMPVMDGLEATRIIMSTMPTPILIVTGSRNASEVGTSIEALAAGALTVMEKPVGLDHPKADELAGKLIRMVKLMSEVSVITRKRKPVATPPQKSEVEKLKVSATEQKSAELICIGVSSGGPQTLKIVLSKITDQFPAPIVVVQHIAVGFLKGLVNWLQKILKIPVHIANDAEKLLPGHVYFAPDDHQMGVTKNGQVKLEVGEAKNGLCPSVAHLYNSVAQEYGKGAIGIILTGMGRDGAKELKLLRDTGALTIAQNKESSLIHGMPGVAIQLGAASYVLSAEEISVLLFNLESNYLSKSQNGN